MGFIHVHDGSFNPFPDRILRHYVAQGGGLDSPSQPSRTGLPAPCQTQPDPAAAGQTQPAAMPLASHLVQQSLFWRRQTREEKARRRREDFARRRDESAA